MHNANPGKQRPTNNITRSVRAMAKRYYLSTEQQHRLRDITTMHPDLFRFKDAHPEGRVAPSTEQLYRRHRIILANPDLFQVENAQTALSTSNIPTYEHAIYEQGERGNEDEGVYNFRQLSRSMKGLEPLDPVVGAKLTVLTPAARKQNDEWRRQTPRRHKCYNELDDDPYPKSLADARSLWIERQEHRITKLIEMQQDRDYMNSIANE